MHAHERTLLGKMGFKDPDKKDRRHDLACQYLAQPDVATRLLSIVPTDGWENVEREFYRADHEFAIEKEKRWNEDVAQIVGFIDLLLLYKWSGIHGYDRGHASYHRGVLVEVKIHPVPVGDIMRQIAVYRQYRPRASMEHGGGYGGTVGVNTDHALVTTAYDLSRDDVAMLTSKDILHVRLGKDFERFCATSTERVSESLEI